MHTILNIKPPRPVYTPLTHSAAVSMSPFITTITE